MNPEKPVGAVVRALRKRQGWTQNRLADEAEIERDYVSRIERGKSTMGIGVLWKVSDALGVLPSVLVALAEKTTHGPDAHKPLPATTRRRRQGGDG